MILNNWLFIWKKIKLDFNLRAHTITTFCWIKDLNLKCKTLKSLEVTKGDLYLGLQDRREFLKQDIKITNCITLSSPQKQNQ